MQKGSLECGGGIYIGRVKGNEDQNEGKGSVMYVLVSALLREIAINEMNTQQNEMNWDTMEEHKEESFGSERMVRAARSIREKCTRRGKGMVVLCVQLMLVT